MPDYTIYSGFKTALRNRFGPRPSKPSELIYGFDLLFAKEDPPGTVAANSLLNPPDFPEFETQWDGTILNVTERSTRLNDNRRSRYDSRGLPRASTDYPFYGPRFWKTNRQIVGSINGYLWNFEINRQAISFGNPTISVKIYDPRGSVRSAIARQEKAGAPVRAIQLVDAYFDFDSHRPLVYRRSTYLTNEYFYTQESVNISAGLSGYAQSSIPKRNIDSANFGSFSKDF